VSGLGVVPSGFATPLLREAFQALTFESNASPQIYVSDPFGPVSPSAIGSLVRPRVTLHSKLGDQVIEPWGPPAPWVFPAAVLTAVAVLVGIGFAIGRRK
jgi:hypothetical protein